MEEYSTQKQEEV